MYLFFLDFILPLLVSTSVIGLFVYLYCAFSLHEYMAEKHPDVLPTSAGASFENFGPAFVARVMYVSRTGGWRQFDSVRWQRYFVITQTVGMITFISTAILCLAFMFPVK